MYFDVCEPATARLREHLTQRTKNLLSLRLTGCLEIKCSVKCHDGKATHRMLRWRTCEHGRVTPFAQINDI